MMRNEEYDKLLDNAHEALVALRKATTGVFRELGVHTRPTNPEEENPAAMALVYADTLFCETRWVMEKLQRLNAVRDKKDLPEATRSVRRFGGSRGDLITFASLAVTEETK